MITAAAAATGAIVAILGLRTWKAQLRGHTEYDLARRLLRSVFKVRDEIAGVRNPFMSAGEIQAAFDAAGVKPQPELGFDKRSNQLVYEKRWSDLADALSTMQVELLEAQVIWGDRAKAIERDLRMCVAELNAAVSLHLRLERNDGLASRMTADKVSGAEAILWQVSDDPAQDAFTAKVSAAVAQFEALCRPALRVRGE